MSDAMYFPGLVPTKFSAVETFLRENEFAQKRIRVADEVVGYPVLEAYEKADVYDWEVFEVGFMALTLALADWTTANLGLRPVVSGGQSFGALAAAVHTGSLSYEDVLTLVQRSTKVEVDYFESQPEPLGCFFFYRMDSAAVDDLVAEFRAAGRDVEVSIYLDNTVHAVSGPIADLEVLRERVREEGGFPFYLMNRSEHCSSVGPLRARLEEEVYRHYAWQAPTVPMLSDVTGELLTDGHAVMTDLLDGWVTPVRWSTVVDGMRSSGARRVVIVGPRNMFARITNNVMPTAVVTPKVADDFATDGFTMPAPLEVTA
ncbi:MULTISPECIES: hypothetical protein [Prauserella salsuginis group]|uniref:[acyl-carrier-protein] S-malonyltransferase n=1 Tax=Prauserella salsuginis TaxID=387889 RepID=A0ABW6G7K1_9PSEU|nr:MULTISPECIES: hypothetical protein [Prauserella salsuginis group]MCR3719511.1 [acyl-carrier-protein] S-malonyltransferase [Prauserella flava]MCR3735475.1 [acyl-carrier-protein] S-malonyltransferase [Prauserella salsuginis]